MASYWYYPGPNAGGVIWCFVVDARTFGRHGFCFRVLTFSFFLVWRRAFGLWLVILPSWWLNLAARPWSSTLMFDLCLEVYGKTCKITHKVGTNFPNWSSPRGGGCKTSAERSVFGKNAHPVAVYILPKPPRCVYSSRSIEVHHIFSNATPRFGSLRHVPS